MKCVHLTILLLAFSGLMGQQIQSNFVSDLEESGRYVKQTEDGGSILMVSTTTYSKGQNDILLIKTDSWGQEEWSQTYGGTAYDRGGSVISTKDGGYLLVGSTSSWGEGNYDLWVIKTDSKGKEEWFNTYGGRYNEYGYVAKEAEEGGYLLLGKKQICKAHNDWSNCYDAGWLIKISSEGKEEWNELITENTQY